MDVQVNPFGLVSDDWLVVRQALAQMVQILGIGDSPTSLFGSEAPPGGDPPDSERDPYDGYLSQRTECAIVADAFAKLFPGDDPWDI